MKLTLALALVATLIPVWWILSSYSFDFRKKKKSYQLPKPIQLPGRKSSDSGPILIRLPKVG